jgi:hypothetical protein
VCLFTIRFFGGQIYKFSPSSGGHAPVSCVRRQSLVLQPLSTAVRSLGDRRMAFTRLGGFRFGSRVRAANRIYSPCMVVLVMIGGFWRFRVDGLVLWCQHVRHRRWLSRQTAPPLSFSCFVIVCVSLDSLFCTYINLVIGSRPECVTDSLFK